MKHEDTVALEWCSKKSLEKILGFLSIGKVDITDLDLTELVELMEATQLLLVENLFKFVESTVNDLLFPPRKLEDYDDSFDDETMEDEENESMEDEEAEAEDTDKFKCKKVLKAEEAKDMKCKEV